MIPTIAKVRFISLPRALLVHMSICIASYLVVVISFAFSVHLSYHLLVDISMLDPIHLLITVELTFLGHTYRRVAAERTGYSYYCI